MISGSPSSSNRRGYLETNDAKWFATNRHFLCAECHKYFRSKKEYFIHAEDCLLEAFEHEVRANFASTSADTMGQKNGAENQWDAENNETTRSKQNFENERNDASWDAKEASQFDMTLKRDSDDREADRRKSEEIIVGPRGTKLMVSVEPQTEQRGESEVLDDDDEEPPQLESEIDPNEPSCMETVNNDDIDFEEEPLSFLPQRRSNKSGSNDAYMGDNVWKPKMECPTCGLVLYKHNFSTHYRIHTGELPFACDYCSKRFRTTSSLKVHIRAHTGERPYQCPSCSYATVTKRNLDRHIVNHHIRVNTLKGPLTRRGRYQVAGLPQINIQKEDENKNNDPQGQFIMMNQGDDNEQVEYQEVVEMTEEQLEHEIGNEYIVEEVVDMV